MPCDSGGPYNSSDDYEARRRIAELEEAMCGLCQMLESAYEKENPPTVDPSPKKWYEKPDVKPSNLHPQLKAWYEKHRKQPGCEAGKPERR